MRLKLVQDTPSEADLTPSHIYTSEDSESDQNLLDAYSARVIKAVTKAGPSVVGIRRKSSTGANN